MNDIEASALTPDEARAADRAMGIFRGRAHVERFAADDVVAVVHVDRDSQAIVVRTSTDANVCDVLTVLDDDRDGKFAAFLLESPGLSRTRLRGQPAGRMRIERPTSVSKEPVHFVAATFAVPRRAGQNTGTLSVLDDAELEQLLRAHYSGSDKS